MDALKEIAGLANHLRHGNVTLWAIADDEYCAEMGLTVEEQGETLSEFLHGVAERIDSEVRFTEGTSGKAIERADCYAEWLDDIEGELFGERIETFTHGDHERQSERINDILVAAKNKASQMPEGMEWLLDVWPKWSNGEYCKFGDWWTADKYGDYEPKQLRRLAFFTPEQLREWDQDEGDNFGYEWDFMRPSDTTYRPDKVEPPAPEVIAADGEPLEVGQTVYVIANGKTHHVTEADAVSKRFRSMEQVDGSHWLDPMCFTHQRPVLDADGNRIEPGMDVWWVCEGDERGIHAEKLHVDSIGVDGLVTCDPYNGGTWVELEPSELYVHKPVLDADGEPIKNGDEMWSVNTGMRYTVEKVAGESIRIECRSEIGTKASLFPLLLTHERPDSFSLIEQDSELTPYDYAMKCGKPDGVSNGKFQRVDLVRRCKALAEKED